MGITILMGHKKRWGHKGWRLNKELREGRSTQGRVAQKSLDHIEESINETRKAKMGNGINAQ